MAKNEEKPGFTYVQPITKGHFQKTQNETQLLKTRSITKGQAIKDRTSHLLNNSEMSDILINACDENWWYGDTVRDFNAHRFLLGTASPVFHKILYSWEDDDNDKNIAESNNSTMGISASENCINKED